MKKNDLRSVVSLSFKSLADLSNYSCMEMPKLGIISEVVLNAVIDPMGQRKIHFYLYDLSGIYSGPECDLNSSFDAFFGAAFSDYRYFEKLVLTNSPFLPFPQDSCYSSYLHQIFKNSFSDMIHLINEIAYRQIGLQMEFEQTEYMDKNRNYVETIANQLGRKNNRAYPSDAEWQMNFAIASSRRNMNIAIWNSKMRAPCVATESDIIEFSDKLNYSLIQLFNN